MCGIAGIINSDRQPIKRQTIKSLSDILSDRGPDQLGFLGWSGNKTQCSTAPEMVAENWLCLVHRRLSILDLSKAGWQPMTTNDGCYAIVFNGEIYNYLELQTELKSLGYTFNSQSDTEVLLTAYVHWGKQALSKLVGMFSFAVLDTNLSKLFLVRDFFGIKPLYYTFLPQGFAFASEIKALLTIPGVTRQLNAQAVYEYLRTGITDHNCDTLFANIKQLPPAHYLEISLDLSSLEILNQQKSKPAIAYWHIDVNQHCTLSYQGATAKLRELFLDNIKLHLRSDVPIGAALSGGIDSSAIAMSMRYLQGNKLELHTFSYVADDPIFNEEKWIDLVGNKSGANINKIKLQPEELISDIEHLIYLQDLPFGSTSIYAQYRVFKQAKKMGIKVMLDGQGADELLGGYPPYLGVKIASLIKQGKWLSANKLIQNITNLPKVSLGELLIRTGGFLLPPIFQLYGRKLVGKDLFPSWLNQNWLEENQIIAAMPPPSKSKYMLREQLEQACSKNSLPMLLRYEDRNSMAHSLESRVPFLTPNLVNFIFSLPEEFIISNKGTSKAIFRDAMAGIVPNEILARRDKIGFATPEQKWLNLLTPWVKSVINSDIAAQIPALNIEIIKTETDAILEGKKNFDFRVWRWLNLIKWTEYFCDKI